MLKPRRRSRHLALAVACFVGLIVSAARGAEIDGFPGAGYLLAPGRLIDVGGYRVNMYCSGSGSPAVVLDAGAGWGAWAWGTVQPAIASFATVCSYDRPGYGFSDMGPLPRTSGRIVDELRIALAKAAVRPPYVLVGWSFGAMNMRLFADRHRGDVAGLVTIDGSHEDMRQFYPRKWLDGETAGQQFFATCAAAARAATLRPGTPSWETCSPAVANQKFPPQLLAVLAPQARKPDSYETQASESLELLSASASQLRAARCSYGSLPLEVLRAAGNAPSDPEQAAFDAGYLGLQQQVAGASSAGELLLVDHASHAIQIDRPQIVIDAIRHVVEDARRSVKPDGNCAR